MLHDPYGYGKRKTQFEAASPCRSRPSTRRGSPRRRRATSRSQRPAPRRPRRRLLRGSVQRGGDPTLGTPEGPPTEGLDPSRASGRSSEAGARAMCTARSNREAKE